MRPHYLLRIVPDDLIGAGCRYPSVPEWVEDSLRISKCVVVRRGSGGGHHVPIGIRGGERNQRWAAFCEPRSIRGIITPPQLRGRAVSKSRTDHAPALRALHILKGYWKDRGLVWGPGGSVGFELATGLHVVTPNSDLDIVIFADLPLTADEANFLCDCAMDLAVSVDIHVETPVCGFSLEEYVTKSPAPILLRTPGGVMLGSDPWAQTQIREADWA